jgi:hypothetical protein
MQSRQTSLGYDCAYQQQGALLLSETATVLMTITTVIYVIIRIYLFRDEWLLILSINSPNVIKPVSLLCLRNNPPLVHILRKLNAVHALSSNF